VDATQLCFSSAAPSHCVPSDKHVRYLFWLPLPQEVEQSDHDVQKDQFEEETEENLSLGNR